MPRFVVPAADIDIAGVPLDEPLPVSWLEEQLADTDVKVAKAGLAEGGAAGHVRVRLSRSGNEIVVRGRVEARLTVPCARCLEPATLSVDGPVALVLKPERAALGGRRGKASKAKAAGAATTSSPSGASGGASGGGASGGASATGRAERGAARGGERGRAATQEYEFSSDEADVDTFDGETVVLDELLREAVLLEIPIFPLCSDDCAGIAPGLTSGRASGSSVGAPRGPSADASAAAGARDERRLERPDPRLAPLAALRRRLESGLTESPQGPSLPPTSSAEARADRAGAPKRPQLSASGLRPKKPKKKKS
jgi:uncharacterized protein